MKKQLVLLSVVFAFITLFSGCEQDNGLTTATVETKTNAQNLENAPEGALQTELMSDTASYLKAAPDFKETALDSALLLPLAGEENAAELRSYFNCTVPDYRHINTLRCGDYRNGSTYYKGNHFNNYFYQHFGFQSNLDGEDELYYLYIDRPSIVSLFLSNASANMAMMLFKGRYDCRLGNCELVVEQLIDWSTSSSITDEHLGPKFLEPGYYFLIVDGRPYYPSHYKLQVHCAPVDNCYNYGHTLLKDNFDRYYTGAVTPQSWHWQKWNPYALYDGEVVRNGHTNILKLERKHAATPDQPDVLLNLGERHYGRYQLAFKMWVYRYRSAYFGIQKQLSYLNKSNEFGAQCFFYHNGQGQIKIAGQIVNFHYPQDTWMDIRLDFNLDANKTTLYINERAVAYWPCTANVHGFQGSRRFEAVDFYPYADHSQFYLEDFCFTQL